MAHQHSQRFLKIVDDARKRVRETNVDEVKQKLDRGEKFLLIDVREESEYAKDHLPGAIHLGKGIIERDIEERAPDTNATMILYCGGGFRSALAADNLQKMGYTNVISMDGGVQKVWAVECSTPNILVRRGWSMHSLKPGDMVTVQAHPLRDGGQAGLVMTVTTASGEVLKDHDY